MNLENIKFVLDIDAALLSFSVLRKLGSGKVNNFDERLKSQKLQYLAQAFGVSPIYNYSLYIHGPYSPGLAKDLFCIYENKISPDLSDFIPLELTERFNKLSEFVKDKKNRELELITTYHLLKYVLCLKENDAKKRIKDFKNASDEEVNYSVIETEKIPCLI